MAERVGLLSVHTICLLVRGVYVFVSVIRSAKEGSSRHSYIPLSIHHWNILHDNVADSNFFLNSKMKCVTKYRSKNTTQ